MGSTRDRKEASQQGMKALAFQEPWATFIVTGVKVHEYRSRRIKTPVRDLVVCASKTARVYEPVPGLCYGKAIGLVDVTSCEPDGEGGWVWGLECVLSSLVEPHPSRICEPLPITLRRTPDGTRHDKVSRPVTGIWAGPVTPRHRP